MPDTKSFIRPEDAQLPLLVGIDLGGTNTKMGVVDDLGRSLSWLSIPTDSHLGPEDSARRIGEAVLRVIDEAGLTPSDIVRVGLGSAGPMDIPAGMITTPINLTGWNNFPIRDRVSHYCGLPVTFENDANAAAYGEAWIGAGRDYNSIVLFTLGTGIGVGIVLGDLVLRGEHSHGGESGHIILDYGESARACNCGGRGCLEAYASATGVIRRTQAGLETGRKSSLSARIARGESLTPKLVAVEAEAGDAYSMEIVRQTARYLAYGAVSHIHMLGPEGIFLGGAMTFGGPVTELGRSFLDWVRQDIDALVVPERVGKTAVDFASLGGDAGYIGAAGVARLDVMAGR